VPVEGVTVPVKVGVVTLVRLSVLLGPLSELADRSGATVGVEGGESIVKVILSVPAYDLPFVETPVTVAEYTAYAKLPPASTSHTYLKVELVTTVIATLVITLPILMVAVGDMFAEKVAVMVTTELLST
jgi:hypothetical protein|tara:strand:+ start:1308 stop:1694 length:387 start_codon:yes stop_codon:yes gene_type:complete